VETDLSPPVSDTQPTGYIVPCTSCTPDYFRLRICQTAVVLADVSALRSIRSRDACCRPDACYRGLGGASLTPWSKSTTCRGGLVYILTP